MTQAIPFYWYSASISLPYSLWSYGAFPNADRRRGLNSVGMPQPHLSRMTKFNVHVGLYALYALETSFAEIIA